MPRASTRPLLLTGWLGALVLAAPAPTPAVPLSGDTSAAGGGVSAEAPAAALPCATPWASLALVARKGPLHAHVSVQVLVHADAAAVAATRELAPCPEVDGRVSESTCLVRLESVTDAPFSAPRRSVAWIDPVKGSVQVESWQGKTHRLHRDCAGTRQSKRWRVRGDAEELVSNRSCVASPLSPGLPIVDGTSLAWFASAHRLDREAAHLEIAAWSRDELVRIRLDAREIVSLERRDQPSVQARRVSVTVHETEDDSAVAPFGLTGEVSLWLEIGSGRVLALEGRSPKVGKVRAVNKEFGIR